MCFYCAMTGPVWLVSVHVGVALRGPIPFQFQARSTVWHFSGNWGITMTNKLWIECLGKPLMTVAAGLMLCTPAAAEGLDVSIFEYGFGEELATCTSSVVDGLLADGDNFLAVRTGPGTEYQQIDAINNGDIVAVYDVSDKWVGVMYGDNRGDCGFIEMGQRRELPYQGKKGWVHYHWLKDYAG